MKRINPIPFAALLAACASVHAMDVLVEGFRDGVIPTGYVDVSDGIAPEELTKVSEAPFVDYLIPNNSGTAGVIAQKEGGQYIVDSTVGDLTGGSNNLSTPDRYHVVFEWSDGQPLPFGSDYYGVSWGGWAANETATLVVRINLASVDPLRIYHWFNDGWNYNNHATLQGHNLNITHYDAQGATVDAFSAVLPSGGGEVFFGDHRQFYTAIIDVQRAGEGDFLLIQHEGGNIGYKGTAVAIVEGQVPKLQYAPGAWTDDPTLTWLYGHGQNWFYSVILGFTYDAYPWLYVPKLGWIHDYQAGTMPGGMYFYSPALGPIWTSGNHGGRFCILSTGQWETFR